MDLKICPGLWETPKSFRWAEKQVTWWDGGVLHLGNLRSTPGSFPGQLSDHGGVAAPAGLRFPGASSKELATRILHSLQAQTLYNPIAQGLRGLTTCKESRWQLRKVNNLNTKFDRSVPFPAHKSLSFWGAVLGQNWSNFIGVLEPAKLLLSKCLVNSLDWKKTKNRNGHS